MLEPAPRDGVLPDSDVRASAKPSNSEARAQAELADSLGELGFADPGPRGGLGFVGTTDGYLSGSSADRAADVALGYVADNEKAFGLDAGDIGGLELTGAYTSDYDGVRHLTFSQMIDGVASFDTQLSANVTSKGQLINVGGSPQGDLTLDDPHPDLGKHDALLAARGDVGSSDTGGFGPTESANLVAFARPSGRAELAYDVYVQGGDSYEYEVVVGADSGAILFRASKTDFAADQANVYFDHPDELSAPTTLSFATPDGGRWINDTAAGTRLSGNNLHAYADVNNNNVADASEEVARNGTGGNSWLFSETFFHQAECPPFACTWDSTNVATKATNKNEAITQMFFLANRFHDHLLAPPIGFNEASRNFERVNEDGMGGFGGDAILGEGNDGGGTNNANFSTVPDGTPGRMQMFFFSNNWDVNGSETADIVYHEMTHGLSNRLDNNGSGLGPAQSGAMGEGWSDWYAQDFLVSGGQRTDTPGPNLNMGSYAISLFGPNVGGIRHQRMDCDVTDTASTACPNVGTTGTGGFTYGDLGKFTGSANGVHDNGEIWAQTLWDLRQRIGSNNALAVVTGGLRLSPVGPTFLQERDAILQSAHTLGIPRRAIWEVFAARGMGFSASTPGASSLTATEAFDVPPRLLRDSRTISDPPPIGDGDGFAEPGETVRITDSLRNPVDDAATGVKGTLSTAAPGVLIGTDKTTWANFPASETTAPSQTPYSVTIPASASCSSTIPLHETVSFNEGGIPAIDDALFVGGPSFTTANPETGIPDNTPAGVNVTINLPAGTVSNMDVKIGSLSHTFVADLKMVLTSPSATSVTLINRRGGAGDDMTNLIFDDEAPTSITGIVAPGPFTGRFRPESPLSAFNGENQAGVWTLNISDNAAIDVGTLHSWGLSPALACSTSVAAAPVATTTAASAVGVKAATLAGTVNSSGTATDYAFEFGTTTAYGTRTASASSGSGAAPVARSVPVSGLAAATTYHYRTLALRAGTVIAAGADKTFTTQPAPTVSITSGPANGSTINSNSATFAMTASPAGATLECKLDGAAFAACTSPKQLTGLAGGAHTFTVHAKSSDGVSGADLTRSFTVDTSACDAAKAALAKAQAAAKAALAKQKKAKKKLKKAKKSHNASKIKKAKKAVKKAKKKVKKTKAAVTKAQAAVDANC